MEDFYKSSKFVIAFLTMTLLIQMTFGESVTVMYLYLILFSMIILQSGQFISFLEGVFK